MALGAEIVISAGMGQKAISMFQEKNLPVLQAVNESVEASIQDYVEDKLTELTEGCLHAHDHEH